MDVDAARLKEDCRFAPLLQPGTRIVAMVDKAATSAHREYLKGSTGMVIQVPIDAHHAYRVRFPDHGEVTYRREELMVLSRFKDAGGKNPLLREYDLEKHVIYRCVMGSRAYGLDRKDSDMDVRGIYLAPAELHWSMYGVPEQLEDKENETVFWEIQKFLVLAMKANPNILECLYSPLVEHKAPIMDELFALRSRFLSKLAYQTYNGYVMAQYKKLSQRRRRGDALNWKHAMHCLRLLLAGIALMRENRVMVSVGDWRDKLLAVRAGEVPWDAVNDWREALHAEFEEAHAASSLPERPDYEAIDAFLIKARAAAAADSSLLKKRQA